MAHRLVISLIVCLTIVTVRAADEKIRDAPATNPKRVVYLCDASKSMKEKFALFGRELSKAIQLLKLEQSFTIIFLVDGKAVSMTKDLVPASPENKRKGVDFIKK